MAGGIPRCAAPSRRMEIRCPHGIRVLHFTLGLFGVRDDDVGGFLDEMLGQFVERRPELVEAIHLHLDTAHGITSSQSSRISAFCSSRFWKPRTKNSRGAAPLA